MIDETIEKLKTNDDSMENLDLEDIELTMLDIYRLGLALENKNYLRSIRLHQCKTNDQMVKILCEGIKYSNIIIDQLDINDASITDEGKKVVVDTRKEKFDQCQKAADEGNPMAQAKLGFYYFHGLLGVKKSEVKALEWYQKAADNNQCYAQMALAFLLLQKIETENDDDFKKLVGYFEKASSQNQPQAQLILGLFLLHGWGIQRDEKAAYNLFKSAAESGDIDAINYLAMCYQKGLGVEQNEQKAVNYYLQAAKENNLFAKLKFSSCYSIDQSNIEENKKLANEYLTEAGVELKKAAEKNDVFSKFQLGLCYRYGFGVKQDEKQSQKILAETLKGYQESFNKHSAFQWQGVLLGLNNQYGWIKKTSIESKEAEEENWETDYRPAVGWNNYASLYRGLTQHLLCCDPRGFYDQSIIQGNPRAKHFLALWYHYNSEQLTDFSIQSLPKLYQEAATIGNSYAQANYGLYLQFYEEKDQEKNEKSAIELYKKAIKNPNAQVLLGYCYLFGWSVKKNPPKAFKCFRNAAMQNYPAAQILMALCYKYKIGVEIKKQLNSRIRRLCREAFKSFQSYNKFSDHLISYLITFYNENNLELPKGFSTKGMRIPTELPTVKTDSSTFALGKSDGLVTGTKIFKAETNYESIFATFLDTFLLRLRVDLYDYGTVFTRGALEDFAQIARLVSVFDKLQQQILNDTKNVLGTFKPNTPSVSSFKFSSQLFTDPEDRKQKSPLPGKPGSSTPPSPPASQPPSTNPSSLFGHPSSFSALRINTRYLYEDNDILVIFNARKEELKAAVIATDEQSKVAKIDRLKLTPATDNLFLDQVSQRLTEEKDTATDQNSFDRCVLMPFNKGGAHWVGILLDFKANGSIRRAEYINPLGFSSPPDNLVQQIRLVYPECPALRGRDLLIQNDLTSCGAYTVENLLIAALDLSIERRSAREIRRQHLDCLKGNNLAFYNEFYPRQRDNCRTVASIVQQKAYLRRLNTNKLSMNELLVISTISELIHQINNKELQDNIWLVFASGKQHQGGIFYNKIRTVFGNVLSTAQNGDKDKIFLLIQNIFQIGVITDREQPLDLSGVKLNLNYEALCSITSFEKLTSAQEKELLDEVNQQIANDKKFAIALQKQFYEEGMKEMKKPIPK